MTERARDEAGTLDYDTTYYRDWRPIIEPNGRLNWDALKRELHDYSTLLHEVPKVYDHVTNGRISKPNTKAYEVISVHDDVVTDLVEEEVRSAMAHDGASADPVKLMLAIQDAVWEVAENPPHFMREWVKKLIRAAQTAAVLYFREQGVVDSSAAQVRVGCQCSDPDYCLHAGTSRMVTVRPCESSACPNKPHEWSAQFGEPESASRTCETFWCPARSAEEALGAKAGAEVVPSAPASTHDEPVAVDPTFCTELGCTERREEGYSVCSRHVGLNALAALTAPDETSRECGQLLREGTYCRKPSGHTGWHSSYHDVSGDVSGDAMEAAHHEWRVEVIAAARELYEKYNTFDRLPPAFFRLGRALGWRLPIEHTGVPVTETPRAD